MIFLFIILSLIAIVELTIVFTKSFVGQEELINEVIKLRRENRVKSNFIEHVTKRGK